MSRQWFANGAMIDENARRYFFAGGAGFSLNQPVKRLDINPAGTLWKDAARTQPATADNDPVGAADDGSGFGNNVTQATSGKRPTLKLNIVNNLPVLRFDGADDGLVSPSFEAQTVFAVVRVATGGNTLVDSAWSKNGADADNIRRDVSSSTSWRGQASDGNADANDWGNSGAFYVSGVRTPLANENIWHVVSAVRGPTSDTAAYLIGGQDNGGQQRYLAFDLARLIVYDSWLSDSDRQAVENNLIATYITPLPAIAARIRVFPTPRQSRFDVPVRSKGYTIPRASKFPVEPGVG